MVSVRTTVAQVFMKNGAKTKRNLEGNRCKRACLLFDARDATQSNTRVLLQTLVLQEVPSTSRPAAKHKWSLGSGRDLQGTR